MGECKSMNRSWKSFIVIVSVMLCVAIGCTAWNVALDKITGNIEPDVGQSNDINNSANGVINNGSTGTIQNGTGTVTNANGQTVTTANGTGTAINNGSGTNTGGSNSGAQAQPAAASVLGYNKNQIVAYYNTCLQSSYAQAKMTDVKTEKVTIGVDSVTINGKENGTVTSIANSIASSNQKQSEDSKSFSRGRASDGTAASTFVLPANLSSAGVKSASISKSGSGYKVVITLISESCGHNTKPPYNASCAWPLDINEVDGALNGFAKITKAQFVYPGTMLTANIDAAGRVSYVRVDMPLTVKDGTGVVTKNIPGVKGMVITASAHGKWVCTHTMTF